MLASRLVRCIEGIAVTKGDEEGPRRLDLQGGLSKELDRDRRYPSTLQLGCDQAHGLVAHRSDWDEKRDVDRVGYE